jgi:hypothetical protein
MASFPLKPGEELELERRASFENRDGTLGLTNVHVFFQTPVGQQIIIPLIRIKSMILSVASFEYKTRRTSGASRCLHPSLLCSEVDFSKAHTGLFIVRFYLESADGSTKILPFEFIADGDPLQNRDHFVERVMRARTAALTAALTITPAPVPTQPTSSCAVVGVVATSSCHVRTPSSSIAYMLHLVPWSHLLRSPLRRWCCLVPRFLLHQPLIVFPRPPLRTSLLHPPRTCEHSQHTNRNANKHYTTTLLSLSTSYTKYFYACHAPTGRYNGRVSITDSCRQRARVAIGPDPALIARSPEYYCRHGHQHTHCWRGLPRVPWSKMYSASGAWSHHVSCVFGPGPRAQA